MTDKDSKDMTASELLRHASTQFKPDASLYDAADRLRMAVGVNERSSYPEELSSIVNTIADKIDAELTQARKEAVKESKKPMWWFRSAIECGEDWPEPREGESFRRYLERCFIPRPRYEDGEPVQDSDIEEIGGFAACCVYMDGSWAFDPDKYEDETNPKPWDSQIGTRNERVKRPASEVLGADGLPIVAWETVWSLSSVGPFTVTSVHADTPTPDGGDSPWADLDDDGLHSWMYTGSLTHTPPDTQECIDDDATISPRVYYVRHIGYDVNLKDDSEVYEATVRDLLRRQRELDKRTGGDA